MNLRHFLPIFTAIALSGLSPADEIHLNLAETPDRVGTYYIADKENSGEVSGPQQARILQIDNNAWPMRVGDWKADLGQGGYMVKYFLLYHLPPLEGKKLKQATLRLFLHQIQHETTEKPLPPVWLFHAQDWADENWNADSQGLRHHHFSDNESFSQKLQLCTSDARVSDFLELDVSKWILSDYQRKTEPVAAFRLEIGDHETLDISDDASNSYTFGGTSLQAPRTLPTLILSFE